MTALRQKSYPTKAKVEHAIKMARLAGIDNIGSIEMAPDGTIRIAAAPAADASADDEVARWRNRRGK